MEQMEERLWNSKGGLPRRKGTHSKRALHLVGGGGGGGGAQGAFQSSNRRPSTHRQPPLPEQQQQQLQQVYQDALRCCVFSILYSNSNELQLQLPLSSSTTAPALALALALAQTAGGGGAGASASNPPPLGQQQQQSSSKSSSFLKLTSKLKSSSSIAAATSSYSSSSESVLSPDNSTVILGKDAVRRFREDLETSINSIKRDLQSLPENLVNSCFVAAGERLLSFDHQNLSDVKELIKFCASLIDSSLRANEALIKSERSAQDHDDLIYATLTLFMAIVVRAVTTSKSGGSSKNAVAGHELMHLREAWTPLIYGSLRGSFKEKGSSSGKIDSLEMWLQIIYDMPKTLHQTLSLEAKKRGNYKWAFLEIKQYIAELGIHSVRSSQKTDFISQQAYDAWHTAEMETNIGLMKTMAARYGPPPSSASSEKIDSVVPENPQQSYILLLSKCVDYDLKRPANNGCLSKMSNQLLSECGLRWRLGKHFRSAALLDIMIQRYRAKAILIEDVFLVFRDALKLFKSSLAMKRADCDYFAAVIKSLESRLLDHLSCFTDDFRTISPDNARYADAKMQMITYMLSEISNLSGLLKISTSQKQIETPGKIRQEILHKLSCAVVVRFDFLTTIASRKAGVTDLKRLTLLSKLVNEDINKFEIYYPTPILKDLDVGGPQQQQQQQQPVRDSSVRIKNIATDTFLKYIILEMENIKHGGLSSYQINETLDLYKAIRLLYEICEDSESPVIKNFKIEEWLEPFMYEWLDRADDKLTEWVKPAVDAENYTPILPPNSMYSSSVIDIFQSFYSTLDFIDNFRFGELGRKDKLVQKFIKTLSRSLQEYSSIMRKEFDDIMDRGSSDAVAFTKESCIKLNNTLGALQKLKDILVKLGVNENTSFNPVEKDKANNRPVSEPISFKITIVRAVDFQDEKSWFAVDAYVRLLHGETELEKTRVVEKNRSPVWNTSFKISFPGTLAQQESFIKFAVLDKEFLGDKELGCATLYMRDEMYKDFLSHDVEISLQPRGRLYVRIMKEGEIADNGWWMRKAAESLTFAIEDMVMINVEQISRYFKKSLMSTINAKPSTVASFFSAFTSSSTSSQISAGQMSDGDIEESMLTLLSYLDEQLGLFNEFVDPKLGEFIIKRNPWMKLQIILSKPSDGPSTTSSAPNSNGSIFLSRDTYKYCPNIIVKMVWRECLKCCHSQLIQLGGNGSSRKIRNFNGRDVPEISDAERQKALKLEAVVEIIKSLIYGGGSDNAGGGFSLDELEDSGYLDFRNVLKSMIQ